MESFSRLFGPPASAPVLQPAKGASSVLPEKPAFRDALYGANYDVVTSKVRGGMSGTKALAQFLVDLAAAEESYGQANLKLSKKYSLNLEFKVDEKAVALPSLQRRVGKQHLGFAICIRNSIASLGLSFLEKGSRNPDLLSSQGRSVLEQLLRAKQQHDKCRSQYQASCAHAEELVSGTTVAKKQNETEAKKESEDDAIADDSILTKVWESLTPQSTTADRQTAALRALVHHRQEYFESVESLNHVAAFVRAAMEANLNAFEMHETKRAELQVKMLKRLLLAKQGQVEKLQELHDGLLDEVRAESVHTEIYTQRESTTRLVEEIRDVIARRELPPSWEALNSAFDSREAVQELLRDKAEPPSTGAATPREELTELIDRVEAAFKDRCEHGSAMQKGVRHLITLFQDIVKCEESYAASLLRVGEKHERGYLSDSLARNLNAEGNSVKAAALEMVGVLSQSHQSYVDLVQQQEQRVINRCLRIAEDTESSQKDLHVRITNSLRRLQQHRQGAGRMEAKCIRVEKEKQEAEAALATALEASNTAESESRLDQKPADPNSSKMLMQLGLRETVEQRIPRLQAKLSQLSAEQTALQEESRQINGQLEIAQNQFLEESRNILDGFAELESLRISGLHEVFEAFETAYQDNLQRVDAIMEVAGARVSSADVLQDLHEFIMDHAEYKPPLEEIQPLVFGSERLRQLVEAEIKRMAKGERRSVAGGQSLWDHFRFSDIDIEIETGGSQAYGKGLSPFQTPRGVSDAKGHHCRKHRTESEDSFEGLSAVSLTTSDNESDGTSTHEEEKWTAQLQEDPRPRSAPPTLSFEMTETLSVLLTAGAKSKSEGGDIDEAREAADLVVGDLVAKILRDQEVETTSEEVHGSDGTAATPLSEALHIGESKQIVADYFGEDGLRKASGYVGDDRDTAESTWAQRDSAGITGEGDGQGDATDSSVVPHIDEHTNADQRSIDEKATIPSPLAAPRPLADGKLGGKSFAKPTPHVLVREGTGSTVEVSVPDSEESAPRSPAKQALVEVGAESIDEKAATQPEASIPPLVDARRVAKPRDVALEEAQTSVESPEKQLDRPIPTQSSLLRPVRPGVVSRVDGVEVHAYFNLPEHETVIESFLCAFYRSSLPMQGRLFLTAKYLCFVGWGDTQFSVHLSEIESIERMNTVYVVPNALGVRTVHGKMLFFASFLDRDGCYKTLSQLVEINRDLASLVDANSAIDPSVQRDLSTPAFDDGPVTAVLSKEKSVRSDARLRPSSSSSLLQAAETDEELAKILHELPPPPREDMHMRKNLEVAVDETIPVGVADFQKLFWGPDAEGDQYFGRFLRAIGDCMYEEGDWASTSFVHPITKEAFGLERKLFYDHPRTSMMFIGPPSVPTHQIQRVRFEGTNPRHDRMIIETEMWFEKIPYNDYFIVESRWVATRKAPSTSHDSPAQLRIQIGVGVVFKKSTVLQKQIRTGTIEELKQTYRSWLKTAREALEERDSGTITAHSRASSLDGFESPRQKMPLSPSRGAALAAPRPLVSFLSDRALVYFLFASVLLVVYRLLITTLELCRLKDVIERQPLYHAYDTLGPTGSLVGVLSDRSLVYILLAVASLLAYRLLATVLEVRHLRKMIEQQSPGARFGF